jgi:hypothetical protein
VARTGIGTEGIRAHTEIAPHFRVCTDVLPALAAQAAAMRSSLLIAVAAVALAACGEQDKKSAAKPAADPIRQSGTPFPTSVGGSLHAGTTYTTEVFDPHIKITPAPGKWVAEVGELETDFSVAKRDIKGQAILAFHRVSRVFDAEKGGREVSDMVPAPDDFAAWLEQHPHLDAGKPKRVTRLGLQGVRIDVRAVSHPPKVPDECGRHADRCVPLIYDGTDVIFYTYGTVESRVRFYVLELDGGDQLVVEEYFENPEDFQTERHSLERTLSDAATA